jgi:hypothetical protein
MRKLLTIGTLLFISFRGGGQSFVKTSSNTYRLETAFSVKATVEFGAHQPRPNPTIRLAGDAGVGAVFLGNWIYPTLNQEFEFYNGGLGSSNRNDFSKGFCLDAITALTVTLGWTNMFTRSRQQEISNRNIPLYYFGDFIHPALQNPFDYSMSVGTNLIFTTDGKKKNQRVGFINLHVSRFQLSYYNDGGTPMNQTYLGDRSDRYYTGGGMIAVDLPQNTAVSSISLAYYKFTGYTRNAFELSNQLYLSYMNYHDEAQKFYNKSLWSLTLANQQTGLGLSLKSYNVIKWDMQDYIHSAIFNTFHFVPYPSWFAFEVNYTYSFNQTGLQ